MSRFGWAYVNGIPTGSSAVASGPTGSIQFHSASQLLSGTSNFTYDTSTNKVTLLGQLTGSSLVVSASVVSASTYLGITSGGTPGGANKQIQFNSGSTFSGSQNLTYDYSTGQMTLTGTMVVSGTLYANEYYTNIISSSIIYSSGSTKFGDDAADTHQFTGSILGDVVSGTIARFTTITGSNITGTFAGNGSGLTSLTASNITNFTTDVRNQFSAGTGITINAGVVSASNVPNSSLQNSSIALGTTVISLGTTGSTIQGLTALTSSNITGTTLQFTTISGSSISASSYFGIPSASAGGVDKTIQFNSGSAFSGSSNLAFDYTNNQVKLTGTLIVSGTNTVDIPLTTDINLFPTLGNNTLTIGQNNLSKVQVGKQIGVYNGITIVDNDLKSSSGAVAIRLGGSDTEFKGRTFHNADMESNVASLNIFNTSTSTTVQIAGYATTLNIGSTFSSTAAQTVTIGGTSTNTSTYNLGTGPAASARTKTINIGTEGLAGSTTNVNIGSAVANASGSTTINNALTASVGITGSNAIFTNITASSVSASGATTIGGNLNVNGGQTTVQSFTASAGISSSAGLQIGGNTLIGGSLIVSGNTTLGDASSDVTRINAQLTSSGGIVLSSAPFSFSYLNVTTNFTMTTASCIIGVSASAPLTITLPSASATTGGRYFIIKDEAGNSATNAITISCSVGSGDTIDNVSSSVINVNNGSYTIYRGGTNKYYIV